MDEELRIELERMREEDQAIRKEAWQVAREHGLDSQPYAELRERGLEVDAKNTARLLEILEARGWPGSSRVGEKASGGAFLILQHADLATQKRYLPMLREATAEGEVDRTCLPLLEDRVRMREGEKQIYGSQIVRGEDGKFAPWPIEDEEHVDERRAQVGLGPLAEYLKRIGL